MLRCFRLRTMACCGALLVLANCTVAQPSKPTPVPTLAAAADLAPSVTPPPTAMPPPTTPPTVIPTPATPPAVIPTPTMPPTAMPTPIPAATACGETHGQIEQKSLASAFLSNKQAYRVYLPPCYAQQTSRRYPVLYLLHGLNHDDSYWDALGVNETADQLIAHGEIPPLLIIMPDANRKYGALEGNPPPFEGFLMRELLPQIDRAYRAIPDRAHRAIGGISLGGGMALLLASTYPRFFGAVGGHSPAIGQDFGIVPRIAPLAKRQVRVYLDVGNHDLMHDRVVDLDRQLAQAGVPHEAHVFAGRHVDAYWTKHLANYLQFYTAAWH